MSIEFPPPLSINASNSSSSLIQPSSSVTRPSLQRSNPSYASNTSSTTGSGASGGGSTRLLWRGSIVTNKGYKLYGVAIIAHLFSVPSQSRNVQTPPTSNLSPFEDPFSSSSSSSKRGDTGADMCLGLEMLRGKDLYLLDNDNCQTLPVQHVQQPSDSDAPSTSPEIESRTKTSKKGKGKELENDSSSSSLSILKIETPTDVRVYIDERCRETVEWFQDTFCRQGCQGKGIRLDAGGEQIVIFAQLPSSTTTTTSTSSPSTSSTTLEEAQVSSSLPPLTLLLGRPFKPIVRKPRPDDPLPRESLFTAKLRKTASLPSTAFSKTSLSQQPVSAATSTSMTTTGLSKKKKSLSSKDKAIASLLGNNNGGGGGSLRPVVPQRRQSSIPPPNIPLPFPSSSSDVRGGGNGNGNGKRSLSRSFSTSSTFSSNSNSNSNHHHHHHKLFSTCSSSSLIRQGSLPPPPPQPPLVNSETSSSTTSRAFKRSRSSLPGTTTNCTTSFSSSLFNSNVSPPPLPLPPTRSRSRRTSHAPPSPTPSIASTTTTTTNIATTFTNRFGQEVEVEEGEGDNLSSFEEEEDRLEELREIGIKRQRSTNGVVGVTTTGGGLMKRSLSVPIGGKFLSTGGNGGTIQTNSNSVKVEGGGGGGGQVNAIELRNKNTVKKLTANRLQSLGIGKDHFEFKDLFLTVNRGVAFALRSQFRFKILSKPDRDKAEQLVDEHLLLYLSEEYQNILMQVDPPGQVDREEGMKVESKEMKEEELEATKTVIDFGEGGDSMNDTGQERDKLTGERENGETSSRPQNNEDEDDHKFKIPPRQQQHGTSSDTIVGDDQDLEMKEADHRQQVKGVELKERRVNVL
ncbi:hypothetical protein JCM3765_005506 [Sporobolomyces pararoseus]